MSHRIKTKIGDRYFESRQMAAEHCGMHINSFLRCLRRVKSAGIEVTEASIAAASRPRHNARCIRIGDVEYLTLRAAATAVGLTSEAFSRRHKKLVANNKPITRASIARAGVAIQPKAISVTVFGKQFKSIAAAARHFNLPENLMRYRLLRAHETKTPIERWIFKRINRRLSVVIDGKSFDSIHAACVTLNCSRAELLRRVRAQQAGAQPAAGSLPALEAK